MVKYTKEIHARRLIEMLETEIRVCLRCPAGEDYRVMQGKYFTRAQYGYLTSIAIHTCDICKEFVGYKDSQFCPCNYYNSPEETTKVSWIALEKKGYLNWNENTWKQKIQKMKKWFFGK
jgi:hypothetical protein